MNKHTRITKCPVCVHEVIYPENSSRWECTFCRTSGTDSSYQTVLPFSVSDAQSFVRRATEAAEELIPSSIKTSIGMAEAMVDRQIKKMKDFVSEQSTAVDTSIGPKYDEGKLQYGLIPPIATRALAQVLTFGAAKYAPNSWQKVPDGERRYTDALYRHMEAYRMGESIDTESKLSHLAHAITNIAFLLHFEEQRKKEQ